MLKIYLLIFYLQFSFGNLVVNPNFEAKNLSELWDGNGGEIILDSHNSRGGHFALKAYNRTRTTEGVSQNVHMKPGSRYQFSVNIKQLTDEINTTYQSYSAEMKYSFKLDTSQQLQFGRIAKTAHIQSLTGWFELKGSFIAPQRKFNSATLLVFGPEPDVVFLVDDFYLEEIAEDKNWTVEANKRIEQIRKNKIHFNYNVGPQFNPADITVHIDLKRHMFGFGAFVDPSRLSDPKYQQLFYDTFNWATVQASTRTGRLDHGSRLKAALQELKKNRVKVRGQSLFSDSHGTNYFVQRLTDTALNHTIQQRASYLKDVTKGLITQWDVLDNILDHQFFGEKSEDLHNAEQVYKLLHQADPSVQLYTTDYDVLEDGYKTHAYTELARLLKKFGLHGIGTKTSYTKSVPDPTILKFRLDDLGTAGLPVWVTDFTVRPTDDSTHADWFEMAMRMYFSHPSVEGVTVNAFSDLHSFSSHNALFGGSTFQITASARRLLNLIKKEWSTHVTHHLSEGMSLTVNGFHGDYDVTVYHKGKPIEQTELHLGKSDVIYRMRILGNGTEITLQTTRTPIVLPTTTPSLAPPITSNPLLTTGRQNYVGTATSSSVHSDLQCVTRWSNISDVAEGARVDIGCLNDEVLTGCSSVKKDVSSGEWNHKGEILARKNRQTVCRALNGVSSSTGVFAVSRCCSANSLVCSYRSSGPSQRIKGALTLTVCPDDYIATGCMGSQYHSHLLGAYPADGKGCLSENGGTIFGSMSAAACCKSPDLTCTTVTSRPSDLTKGSQASVTCGSNQNYVMTSCNGRSLSGKIAGAYVIGSLNGDMCVVFNGEDKGQGENGVEAVAVCCHIGHKLPLIG